MKELILPLPNGCSLRCGEGVEYQWVGSLRLCGPDGGKLSTGIQPNGKRNPNK